MVKFRNLIFLPERAVFTALAFLFLTGVCGPSAAGQAQPVPLVKCWEVSRPNMSRTPPASDNDSEFYYLSDDRILSALSAHGLSLWTTDLGAQAVSNPAYLNGRIYLVLATPAPASEQLLRVISARTGLTIHQESLKTNEPLKQLTSDLYRIFKTDDRLLIKSPENTPYEINFHQTATERSTSAHFGTTDSSSLQTYTESAPISAATTDNATFVISDLGNGESLRSDIAGNVEFFDRNVQSKRWSLRLGGQLIAANEHNGILFLSSADNYLYAVQKSNGKLRWRRRFENRSLNAIYPARSLIISSTINGSTTAFTDFQSGRVTNVLSLPADEYFINQPIVLNDKIILFSNRGIIGFQFTQCTN